MAKSMSLSWLWLPNPSAGAAVRSQRSATGRREAPRRHPRGRPPGGEMPNSLASSIIRGDRN
uniref:Uncharacterized protein n=1 Tax=Arundo donax TaxID=35708 RepID=A0A0A9H515_ARUDO